MRPQMDVKDAILQMISCMLSGDGLMRNLAEARMQALEVTEYFGSHLVDIVVTTEEDLPERQMATILLRQYVQTHWTCELSTFICPAATSTVKSRIRNGLLTALSDPLAKVRKVVALTLATIAKYDYPMYWLDFGRVVMCKLNSENLHERCGTVEFLLEFCRIAACYKVNTTAPNLYVSLYQIIEDATHNTLNLRADAVVLFGQLLSANWIDREARKELLPRVIHQYCALFVKIMTQVFTDYCDLRLLNSILLALSQLVGRHPRLFSPIIEEFLPNIWLLMSNFGDIYIRILEEGIPVPADADEDSLSSPMFYVVVNNIFVLVHAIINTNIAVTAVKSVLPQLIYYIMTFMALSPEKERAWMENESLYVTEDINDLLSSAMRSGARDVLLMTAYDYDIHDVLHAISFAVDKHMHTMDMRMPATHSYTWRIKEAVAFGIGSLSNFFISLIKENKMLIFDLQLYLNHWANIATQTSDWFLVARLMWVGAKYSTVMPIHTLKNFLGATITNLGHDCYILKYAAVRALMIHTESFETGPSRYIYADLLEPTIYALIEVLGSDTVPTDILQIGMRAVHAFLQIEPDFIVVVQHQLIQVTLLIFIKHMSHPVVLSCCQKIVQMLASHVRCSDNLEQVYLPNLMNIIINTMNENSDDSSKQNPIFCALEILKTIVKHVAMPCNDVLIQQGFVTAYRCVMSYEDNLLLQSGAECVRAYLIRTPEQICAFVGADGRLGTDYILDVLRYLLDPQKIEVACKQVGRLCIAAMSTLGNILEQHIDSLLRLVLSKMQRANVFVVEEGLVIIFAHLFYNHLDAVLHFLSNIPGPSGESALAFVLNRWLEKYNIYYGNLERNLSIMALARLFEHGIRTQDPRIGNLVVAGDPIPVPTEREIILANVATNRATQGQATDIPVLPKIFKSLVQVLMCDNAASLATQENGSSRSAPSSRSDISLVNMCYNGDPFEDDEGCTVDNPWGPSSTSEVEDDPIFVECRDDEDDSLDKNSPYALVNISELLIDYMKKFSLSPYFYEYQQYLGTDEINALNVMGISVRGPSSSSTN